MIERRPMFTLLSSRRVAFIAGCVVAAALAGGCAEDEPGPSTSAGTTGSGGEGGEGASTTAGEGGAGGGTGGDVAAGGGGEGGGTVCAPGESVACYSGPAGTAGVGLCIEGSRVCAADGSGFGPCEGEVTPAVETCNSAGDDDCDGSVNEEGEGCTCVPGTTVACYSGPPATEGVGPCVGGEQTCQPDGVGYGPCVGEVTPGVESCLSTVDEDCDGAVNEDGEGCVCTPGSSAPCYTGPEGTEGVGLCVAGTMTCNAEGTAYGACEGDVTPAAESCETPGDEDCDGATNEEGAGCACVPGTEAPCYSGPPATLDVGPCTGGTQTCNAEGTGYGACVGEVTPSAETCTTAADDDCDGAVNEEGEGCVCTPGSVGSCYPGPANTENVGLCVAGTWTCNDEGTAFGPCTGAVTPVAETCTTAGDDDCDGATNEEGAGCVCVPGSVASCYSGPPSTEGVGPCVAGTQECNGQGTAYQPCVGEVTPLPETCTTAADDDCDGATNEEGAGCVCLPGSSAACYSGPAGTEGVGICSAGMRTCNAAGTAYGACTGEVLPAVESCDTPADDDCDGADNEGCVCATGNPIFANAGFESGELAPWTTSGTGIITTASYEGTYAGQVTGNQYFQQELATGVPVSSLTSASFWVWHDPAETGPAMFVGWGYADGTSGNTILTQNLTGWRLIDVLPLLDPSRSLTRLQVWGYAGGSPVADVTRLDSVAFCAP